MLYVSLILHVLRFPYKLLVIASTIIDFWVKFSLFIFFRVIYDIFFILCTKRGKKMVFINNTFANYPGLS